MAQQQRGESGGGGTEPVGSIGTEAGGKRGVTLRIDESDLQSTYANTFRADGSADEVILDFGLNRAVPGKQSEMVFKVRNQVILNWRGAKRLALTLANLIRQHEERFGEIDLNAGGGGGDGKSRKPGG